MVQKVKYSGPALVKLSDELEIAYDIFGEDDAPPVLLVMGYTEQMIFWHEDFCKQLAGKGFRVIRFDNCDAGLSTHYNEKGIPNIPLLLLKKALRKKLDVPYTLSDLAENVIRFMDALELDSVHLVGASMGGMIAQTIAINDPHRVRTLISIFFLYEGIPHIW